jgi:hypothetical protein
MLNLSTRRRPWWTIRTYTKLTLHPSIDAYHANRRCHFWIKRGTVKWVKYSRTHEVLDDNEQ